MADNILKLRIRAIFKHECKICFQILYRNCNSTRVWCCKMVVWSNALLQMTILVAEVISRLCRKGCSILTFYILERVQTTQSWASEFSLSWFSLVQTVSRYIRNRWRFWHISVMIVILFWIDKLINVLKNRQHGYVRYWRIQILAWC